MHASLLGADVRGTSAHSCFCKKIPEKLNLINIKKICGFGCACGRKKWPAGACATHYDFSAMCACGCGSKSPHTKGLGQIQTQTDCRVAGMLLVER